MQNVSNSVTNFSGKCKTTKTKKFSSRKFISLQVAIKIHFLNNFFCQKKKKQFPIVFCTEDNQTMHDSFCII